MKDVDKLATINGLCNFFYKYVIYYRQIIHSELQKEQKITFYIY